MITNPRGVNHFCPGVAKPSGNRETCPTEGLNGSLSPPVCCLDLRNVAYTAPPPKSVNRKGADRAQTGEEIIFIADRRGFLASAGAVAASIAPIPQLFARPISASPRDRQLIEIARSEIARLGNMIPRRDVVALANFSLHSAEARFHIVNLEGGDVRSSFVAHGTGSDPENDGWLTHFSNAVGSNASSRGAYLTGQPSSGDWGAPVSLRGLDPDNSNALARRLALRSAEFCGADHMRQNGRLGRSDGSLAISPDEFRVARDRLAAGRLIYAGCLQLG